MSEVEHGAAYEAEHVHTVYEQIASHFSSTRYKPWPIVERFLKSLPDGSVGLDVGCGNGKYLAVNRNIFILASDRSTNLIQIASKHQPHSALVADTLRLPHTPASFDFAISIAVIHHLSTPERRVEALQSVLGMLRPASVEGQVDGGRALIYVWALEQKNSRRGWDEGDEQDVMVPWVLKSSSGSKETKRTSKGKQADTPNKQAQVAGSQEQDKVFYRYYHLYRKGELEHDIIEAGGIVLESGYEKDNWWAIATRRR